MTSKPKPKTPFVTYRGDGSQFVIGVPARDLSAEEWAALTDEQRAACVNSDLYVAQAEPEE